MNNWKINSRYVGRHGTFRWAGRMYWAPERLANLWVRVFIVDGEVRIIDPTTGGSERARALSSDRATA